MKKNVLVSVLFATALTVCAQENLSPKVNILKTSIRQTAVTRAASQDMANAEREGFIITCDPDKSAATIANSMKKLGAEINALMGNQLVVSLPVSQIEAAAAIDGVLLIDLPSGSTPKTDVTRQVTHVKEVLNGTAEKLPQAYTGKGVIIGVIDGGFDYTHPAFKDKDGKLRIKGVYQPAYVIEGGEKPGKINVVDDKGVATILELPGTFITNPDVILDTLKLKETGYHGTHCAAIAAGSIMEGITGVTKESVGGMAPEADIVLANDEVPYADIMKYGPIGQAERAGYNIYVSLFALKDYAAKQGKPMVLSISSNNHEGFHDGTSSQSRLLGNYCKEGNVMALCSSNEGGDDLHVSRKIDAGKTLSIWLSQKRSIGKLDAFVKTAKEIKVNLRVVDCNNKYQEVYNTQLQLTTDPKLTDFDHKRVYMSWSIGDDLQLHYSCQTEAQLEIAKKLSEYFPFARMDMSLSQGTAIGTDNKPFTYAWLQFIAPSIIFTVNKDGSAHYMLQFDITSEEDVMLYAWSDNDCDLLANTMEEPNYYERGTNKFSVGDLNTSGEPVTIGAWVANNQYIDPETNQLVPSKEATVGAIAPFSSFGYDLPKSRTYPDVAAPGYNVLSAINSFDDTPGCVGGKFSNQFVNQQSPRTYTYQFASGTSMSTPVAAGIMALWLQAANDKGKKLTNKDIKDIIAHSSDTDEFTKANPLGFGQGKINAYKGLLYILDMSTSIDGLSQNQPEGVSFRLAGGQLFADGAEEGTPVSLYNLQGVCVAKTAVQNGAISLEGLNKGVYAVQLGKLGSTLIRL